MYSLEANENMPRHFLAQMLRRAIHALAAAALLPATISLHAQQSSIVKLTVEKKPGAPDGRAMATVKGPAKIKGKIVITDKTGHIAVLRLVLLSRFEVRKERIMKNGPVRVGIIGSQFQADCHAAAISMIQDDMSAVAVASPTAAHAQSLADRYKIPRVYTRLQGAGQGCGD